MAHALILLYLATQLSTESLDTIKHKNIIMKKLKAAGKGVIGTWYTCVAIHYYTYNRRQVQLS